MRRALLAGAAAIGLATAGYFAAARAQPEEPELRPNQVAAFMVRKLDFASEALAGITTDDLRRTAAAAKRLELLTQEAGWSVIQTEEYARLSEAFRGSAAEMAEAAEAGQADRAVLAYLDVTMHCVKCHRKLRGRLVDGIAP